jgi:hypothetical protein
MPLGNKNVSDINPQLMIEVGLLEIRGVPSIAIETSMLTWDLLNEKEKFIFFIKGISTNNTRS